MLLVEQVVHIDTAVVRLLRQLRLLGGGPLLEVRGFLQILLERMAALLLLEGLVETRLALMELESVLAGVWLLASGVAEIIIEHCTSAAPHRAEICGVVGSRWRLLEIETRALVVLGER